ncbi:hypothetical protein QYE76_029903 [Lolium multiflorum]|uniref:Uncharacterized protein n=1 Tax=Lolium multiflorum TaxID=4521 RepID=A0AAD8VIR5_LOLMU|nr:hypothetical protein QYE76_029903 [Lolium multiflorum]
MSSSFTSHPWTRPYPSSAKTTCTHASTDTPSTLQRRHAVHGRDARARQNAAETRQLRPRLAISARAWLRLSTRSRQTSSRARPRLVTVEEDDDVRHSRPGRVTRPTVLDHRTLLRDASTEEYQEEEEVYCQGEEDHFDQFPNQGKIILLQMEPYVQTETYDLENGGSLVFERDLYLVSERLERPPPKFHGVRIHDTPTGEQQWMITADLKGSSEPPISERILFSFKACNWPDGLAHALQEGLARVCGQHIAALRGSRFAYFARHDTMGEPMAPSSHPVLMIHVQHLDLMLHETRKDLERTRVYNHRAQMTVAHHAEAIQMLAKDRKILRLQRAKKDATIRRLREKIRTLEVTVRTQQDQIQEMEEEGDDIQGGDDFLSDDNDFEDDEFTDEEDYEFLEAAEDGIIPIDVDEDDE